LLNYHIPVEIPPNESSQDEYKHEIQLKLEQLLERRNLNQAAVQQSINAQAHAQAQAQGYAQEMRVMNQNIAVASPEPIPQQDFSQLQPRSQNFPIPVQEPQQEVSSTPPEVPKGWKAQWSTKYEEW
jgi:hypothetical protein